MNNNHASPTTEDDNNEKVTCPQCLELEEMSKALEDFIGRVNGQLLRSEMSDMELEQIFSACVDPMIVIRVDGIIVRANGQMLTLLGKTREQVVGIECSELLTEKECQLATASRKTTQTDIDLINSAGEQVSYIMTTSRLVTLDGTPGTLAQYKDITERKQAERDLAEAHAALERIAKIDGLTQIPNRRTFDDSLLNQWQQLKTAQQPLSIILCDIDFFKKYNDHYGHQEGDNCLIAVAQALNNTPFAPNGLAARYGGEEFIFLLPNTSLEEATIIAETARTNVENLHIAHAGSNVATHVTLSLGVSCVVPSDESRALDVIKAADDALYRSKDNGRNRVTCAE